MSWPENNQQLSGPPLSQQLNTLCPALKKLLLNISALWDGTEVTCLIDSGSSECSWSQEFALRHGLSLTAVKSGPALQVADGRPLHIKYTMFGHLFIEGIPELRKMTLLVAPLAHADIILGQPWLQIHNPDINWTIPRIDRFRAAAHSSSPDLVLQDTGFPTPDLPIAAASMPSSPVSSTPYSADSPATVDSTEVMDASPSSVSPLIEVISRQQLAKEMKTRPVFLAMITSANLGTNKDGHELGQHHGDAEPLDDDQHHGDAESSACGQGLIAAVPSSSQLQDETGLKPFAQAVLNEYRMVLPQDLPDGLPPPRKVVHQLEIWSPKGCGTRSRRAQGATGQEAREQSAAGRTRNGAAMLQ